LITAILLLILPPLSSSLPTISILKPVPGLFDLLGAGIGYWGIRKEERIQPTMILCYLVFVIMVVCSWKQGREAGLILR